MPEMWRRDAYRNAWKAAWPMYRLVAVPAAAGGGVRTSGKGFMEDRRLSRNVAVGLANTEFILLFSGEGQKPGQGG